LTARSPSCTAASRAFMNAYSTPKDASPMAVTHTLQPLVRQTSIYTQRKRERELPCQHAPPQDLHAASQACVAVVLRAGRQQHGVGIAAVCAATAQRRGPTEAARRTVVLDLAPHNVRQRNQVCARRLRPTAATHIRCCVCRGRRKDAHRSTAMTWFSASTSRRCSCSMHRCLSSSWARYCSDSCSSSCSSHQHRSLLTLRPSGPHRAVQQHLHVVKHGARAVQGKLSRHVAAR
jgi:hypothetical protein